MKKISLFIFTFIVFTASGQYKIMVKESEEKIGDKKNPCLVVTIYENLKEDIEKAWEKKMKAFGAKVSSKKEIVASMVTIKELGEKPMDIYAQINEKNNNEIELIVAVDLGGAFMNSRNHEQQFRYFEKLLKEFARQLTIEGIENKIKAQEKVVEKNKSELEKLQKAKEKLENDIKSYQQKIAEAENDISKNINEQAEQQQKIKMESNILEELKSKLSKVE